MGDGQRRRGAEDREASANVACGFHASDPMVMVDTGQALPAERRQHRRPSGFADLQGFGRRVINLSVKELEANIAYQLGALQAHRLAVRRQGHAHQAARHDGQHVGRERGDVRRDLPRHQGVRPRPDLPRPGQHRAGQVGAQGRPARGRGGVRRPHLHRQGLPDAAQGSGLDDQGSRPGGGAMSAAWSTSRRSTRPRASASPARSISICVHGDGPTAVTVSKAVRQGLEAAGIRIVRADRDAELEASKLPSAGSPEAEWPRDLLGGAPTDAGPS